MKLKTCCLTIAALGWALPGIAQTDTAQTKAAPQSAPVSANQSLIAEALRGLRTVSGPRPRTPEQKAQEAAVLDRINDLIQAGTQAMHTKNFAAAEADYHELVRMEPSISENYYGLGEALAAQDKTAEALAAYKTAVYWPLNTSPEAVAASQAIESKPNLRGCSFPNDAVAWMKYALLLSQTGQNKEAFAVYSQAIRQVSDMDRSGIVLFSYDAASSPATFQAAAHIALGLLTGGMLSDHEQAMSEFDQARKLAPEAAVTNYYYGYGWKWLAPNSPAKAAHAQEAKAALAKAVASDDGRVKRAAEEVSKQLQ